MKRGFALFIIPFLIAFHFSLLVILKKIEKEMNKEIEYKYKTSLNIQLPSFKCHQKKCDICGNLKEYEVPCDEGFRLIFDDNKNYGIE